MQPSNRTIIGVAMLLFGAVILGVGMHHVVKTGTCSSTGYSSNYGPVPYCPKGTGWWILFIIGGIFLTIIGGFVSAGSALLIVPAVFAGIGIGALSVAFSSGTSSSTKTFAAIFGGAFAFFGIVPLIIAGISAIRRTGARTTPSPFSPTALKTDPIMGAYATPATASSTPSTLSGLGSFSTASVAPSAASQSSAGASSSDALDKLAKLAKLREQGALTEDEFNREKAKLLAEL